MAQTERITDRTPEQIGDGIRFEILPNADGWVAFARWSGTGDNEYDGRGEGFTIETAVAAAVADLDNS